MNLKEINPDELDIKEIKSILKNTTIYDKIEFSDISKDVLKAKLDNFKNTEVKNRTVLLDVDDNRVLDLWFKNWLHCELKNWLKLKIITNCLSPRLRSKYMEWNTLCFYENGQFNFNYTIEDIENYIKN